MEERMACPTFEISRGSLNRGTIWIESVEDLPSAVELMNECARERPGLYFVFNLHEGRALATTDTSKAQAANASLLSFASPSDDWML
jgi:hypothetical protein